MHANNNTTYIPTEKVSILAPYLLVGLCIGLVYFDSVFWKLASPMWLLGLGFWMPTTVPYMTYLNHSYILNIKWLSLLLGYISLIFETVFLFLIWFPRYRIPLIIIGVGLHLGILVCYPIPFFALGITSLYILLLPDSIWHRSRNKKGESTPKAIYYYDAQNRNDRYFKITVQHFDIFSKVEFISKENSSLNRTDTTTTYPVNDSYETILKQSVTLWPLYIALNILLVKPFFKWILNGFNQKNSNRAQGILPESFQLEENNSKINTFRIGLISFFILYCLFVQLLNISHSRGIKAVAGKIGINESYQSLINSYSPFLEFNQIFLGLSTHPVFNEGGFAQYRHIIAITYIDKSGTETWLPIIDKKGQASYYNTGRINKNWTFRVNGPSKDHQQKLIVGLKKYTAFWANKNGISLQHAVFNIQVKKITPPGFKWEKDFLNKQIMQPWQDSGKVKWINQSFFSEVNTIREPK